MHPSPLGRFLRGGDPRQNPPPAFPEPEVKLLKRGWPAAGWIDWKATLEPAAGWLLTAHPQDAVQGLGRVLAEALRAVGGNPAFDELLRLFAAGDRASVEFADSTVRSLIDVLDMNWLGLTDRRRADPTDASEWASSNPQGPDRGPAGFRAYFAAQNLAELGKKLYARRGADPTDFPRATNLFAFFNPISLIMDYRPELGADEVLAVVHALLDPARRRAAPGGLWAEASRPGRPVDRVRVTYGRGTSRLLTSLYDTGDVRRPWAPHGRPPRPAYELVRVAPAPGAAPGPGDYDAALADLVARGVTRASVAGGAPALEAMERAGFVGGVLPPEAARAIALLARG